MIEGGPEAVAAEGLEHPPVADVVEGGLEPPPSNDDVVDVASDAPRLRAIIESLLFVSERPLSVDALKSLLGLRKADPVREALASLAEASAGRGIVVPEVAGGWQLRTHPDSAAWVQKVLAARPVRLSRPQLETLAIVAYRQPITRPEIDEIRGVDSGAVLKLLMERDLLRILGKKEEPGRPMLYGTSKHFLEFFNLKDLRDMPTLREFHELSQESAAKVEALDAELGEGEGGGAAVGEAGEVAGVPGAAGAAERAEHDAVASEAVDAVSGSGTEG
ncbi:MAG: SMC-Scp complex subunit ScpB [Deltaproteobacteria bacterium]|nr:SMC-Scp complex subunit ScpB [Deltaproteobacteria bacterium]